MHLNKVSKAFGERTAPHHHGSYTVGIISFLYSHPTFPVKPTFSVYFKKALFCSHLTKFHINLEKSTGQFACLWNSLLARRSRLIVDLVTWQFFHPKQISNSRSGFSYSVVICCSIHPCCGVWRQHALVLSSRQIIYSSGCVKHRNYCPNCGHI